MSDFDTPPPVVWASINASALYRDELVQEIDVDHDGVKEKLLRTTYLVTGLHPQNSADEVSLGNSGILSTKDLRALIGKANMAVNSERFVEYRVASSNAQNTIWNADAPLCDKAMAGAKYYRITADSPVEVLDQKAIEHFLSGSKAPQCIDAKP